MKIRNILISSLALSLLTLGINMKTTHANSYNTYSHPHNALTNYIRLGHFNTMINNHNYSVSNNYYLNHNINPNRTLRTTGGNWKDSYKPYAILNDIDHEHNPQSVVIKPNGTTFISYGLNNKMTRIVRYNINNTTKNKNGTTILADPHYGHIFKGGHGQSMAWNPKTNQLWLQNNNGSATNNVTMMLINQKTLKPMHQVKFNFDVYPFGDVLAFDNHGTAYTATDTYNNSSHRGAPVGSLKLYKGTLKIHSANFHMIRGLRHTPGAIMQNLAYNPANHRMYALANGNYVSFPINQKITPKKVHSTKLNEHYEPEDLAFYHGHTYLMLHYPSQLMISTNDDYAPKHINHKRNKRVIKHNRNHQHNNPNRKHRNKKSLRK